jgi:hypothetical protein
MDMAAFYGVDYGAILAARDLRSGRLGPLKVFIKSLLKKY